MFRNVVFQIACNSTDIRRDSFGTLFVDNFISAEETKGIWVIFEGFNNAEYAGEIVAIVRAGRITTIKTLARCRSIHVQNHIYTNSIEKGRALVMINARIEVVHPKCINLAKIRTELFSAS